MNRPVARWWTYGGLGDVILQTPAIRAWKQQFPHGRLIMYCLSTTHRDILRGNPHIDALRVMTPLRGALSAFRFGRPQATMANYGWIGPSLFNEKHASALIGEMFGVAVEKTTPEIYLTPAEEDAGRARTAGFSTPVALNTTALCSANKLWTAERWAALATECPELDFVQVGSLSEALVPGAHDLRGLRLRESFAVIKHCRAFVGVDSCPAHAAAAFSIPAVVLFGPSRPAIWGHTSATNLYVQQRCSPCIDTLHSGRCPYGNLCMTQISVQAVKDALAEALVAAPGQEVSAGRRTRVALAATAGCA